MRQIFFLSKWCWLLPGLLWLWGPTFLLCLFCRFCLCIGSVWRGLWQEHPWAALVLMKIGEEGMEDHLYHRDRSTIKRIIWLKNLFTRLIRQLTCSLLSSAISVNKTTKVRQKVPRQKINGKKSSKKTPSSDFFRNWFFFKEVYLSRI